MGLCRVAVDLAFGECCQLAILVLLLIQAQLEEIDDLQIAQLFLIDRLPMTELVCPGDERAVAVDLVVLDRLSRRDDRRIPEVLVLDLANDLLALLDEAQNGLARHALRGLAQRLKDLVQALDLLLRLLEMGPKTEGLRSA